MGRRVVCVPESNVFHVGGGTLPKGNPRKTFLNFRNNLTMLYKNLPDNELRRVMRARWWLDRLAALAALALHGNVADFKAILRARRAFRAWRHDFDADREKWHDMREGASVPERKGYSILWKYYARGLRTYDEIEKSEKQSASS